jgi:hypothetical protein
MALEKPLTEYDAVKAWAESLRRQWGGDPLAEDPSMTESLDKFCEFVGEDPDSMIAHCFRIRKSDGERVLSNKWRTIYADRIKEFRTKFPPPEARTRGAAVLGFLIHNGVLIQG